MSSEAIGAVTGAANACQAFLLAFFEELVRSGVAHV